MELTQIMRADTVKTLNSVTSKKRLFRELGEIAAATHGIDAQEACTALQERENLGPTGVGSGIALPHARLATERACLGSSSAWRSRSTSNPSIVSLSILFFACWHRKTQALNI